MRKNISIFRAGKLCFLSEKNKIFPQISLFNQSFTWKISNGFASKPQNPQDKYSKQTMNKLKKDAQEFAGKLILNEDIKKSPSFEKYIIEMKSIDDWKKHVIGNTNPIVLDCYADWCQPCKKLTPYLEEKCINAKGEWILIKVNIDKLPQIASALQLKSVPTVLLIHNGNVIDGFTGNDQNAINKFFDGLKLISGGSKEKDELKKKIDELEKQLESKKYGEISEKLKELLKNEKAKNFFGARILSLLGYCAIKENKKDESLKYLYEINQKFSDDLNDPTVKTYVDKVNVEINFINERMKNDPQLAHLTLDLENNPESNSIRFKLAELQFQNGLHQEAIENCLDIIKIQRNWEENKAQKLLLKIFENLGSANSLVIEGRKKLQRILY